MRSKDEENAGDSGARGGPAGRISELRLSKMALDILSYMLENPQAMDTLEGVAEWWLLERNIRRRTTEIRKALQDLVAKGFLRETSGPDARKRFGINRGRLNEIRELVEEGPAD